MKKLIMKCLIISLFIAGCAKLVAESSNPFSSKSLSASSDVVAIVEIFAGERNANGGYQLKASLNKRLKGGEGSSDVVFLHDQDQMSDEPSKIGGKYLVFLKIKNDLYETNKEGFSVVEVGEFAADRPDLSLVLRKLNLSSDRIVKVDSSDVFIYPVICTYGSEEICEKVFLMLDGALQLPTND